MASNTFHSLRFEDGDVLVKLSSDPNYWLLLHKDTITKAIPQLAGMFRFAGGPTPTYVTDLASGIECSFYTLSIKHVDNTLILSDEKDVGFPDSTKYDAFHRWSIRRVLRLLAAGCTCSARDTVGPSLYLAGCSGVFITLLSARQQAALCRALPGCPSTLVISRPACQLQDCLGDLTPIGRAIEGLNQTNDGRQRSWRA